MSVEFYRESPGKFDSRTLNRKTLSRWNGRSCRSRFPLPLAARKSSLIACRRDAKSFNTYVHIYIYIYT